MVAVRLTKVFLLQIREKMIILAESAVTEAKAAKADMPLKFMPIHI